MFARSRSTCAWCTARRRPSGVMNEPQAAQREVQRKMTKEKQSCVAGYRTIARPSDLAMNRQRLDEETWGRFAMSDSRTSCTASSRASATMRRASSLPWLGAGPTLLRYPSAPAAFGCIGEECHHRPLNFSRIVTSTNFTTKSDKNGHHYLRRPCVGDHQ